jgi:Transposase IS4
MIGPSKYWHFLKASCLCDALITSTSGATTTPTMRDEQEIPGASNRIEDAPSLSAARKSGRLIAPTKRLLESQQQETLIIPPKQPSQKRKANFTIHDDQPTPPPTQITAQSSQTVTQEGTDYVSSQKKRRKTKPKSSDSTSNLRELWEVDFDAATSNQAKFQVLLAALGKEDFPRAIRIPTRLGKANFPEELDPLNPIWLWSKFVTPEVLKTIATNTNEYESLRFEAREHTRCERAWKDLTGADIGAFIGAAMLMGIQPQPSLEDYWNCSEDKPVFPVQKYMTRERFEQTSRYLKINNPLDELDITEYFMKVEPLLSTMREACQRLILLPHTVNIDENLLASEARTVHLVQIDCKAAGKGYKVYTLACGSYLYDWIYTSKAAKVPQAKYYTPRSKGYEDDAFTDTERMVLTLVESMLKSQPQGFQFQVVFDNFFTTTRLFDELRSWGVGAFGTAKAGSGIPKPHIMIDKVATKEKNYGEVVNTVISRGNINCITFIDNGAVWMMSTVHDVANEPTYWRPISNRRNPSDHLARTTPNGDIEIPYPKISHDYNHQMNGSDLCQQSWNEYDLSGHGHLRNWWPLFWHLISASISNSLYLYRLKGFTDSELTHLQLQERLGLQLLRNPASVSRVIESTSIASTKRPTRLKRPSGEHTWTRVGARECVVCSPPRLSQRRGRGRKALQELGINTTTPEPRKRRKRTTFGCYECDVALCKSSWCWQQHHDGEQANDSDDLSTS